MRIITVETYNPQWRDIFELEARRISEIFSGRLTAIHHVGSTSVTGMSSKPTIDILGVIEALGCADSLAPALKEAGYSAYGEYGIPGRRYFVKVRCVNGKDWVDTFHLHFYEAGDRDNIERHLAVRDYLSSHPEKISEYSLLKTKLAEIYSREPEEYVSGKEEYVSELERESISWYRKRQES